jgi:hypothetical protein
MFYLRRKRISSRLEYSTAATNIIVISINEFEFVENTTQPEPQLVFLQHLSELINLARLP